MENSPPPPVRFLGPIYDPWAPAGLFVLGAFTFTMLLLQRDPDLPAAFVFLVLGHALYLVLMPLYVSKRSSPGRPGRAFGVMLASGAPWLLVVGRWGELQTPIALSMTFGGLMLWAIIAAVLAWLQKPGPMGRFTKGFLVANVAIGVVTIILMLSWWIARDASLAEHLGITAASP